MPPVQATNFEENFSVFKIAFPWFAVIACLLVWLVAIPVSYFTGGEDLSKSGTKLLTPLVHSWIPKEIRDMELKQVQVNPKLAEKQELEAHWTWSSPDAEEEEAAKAEESKKLTQNNATTEKANT